MTVELETHRFPCDSCGADLRYEPGTDKLTCDHCGAEQQIDGVGFWSGITLKELDFEAAVAGTLPDAEIEETRVLDCPNCGAQVEFDEATHSDECPFCATPVVTAAQTAMTNWLGQLWFAPSGLRQYARKGRRLTGVYVPYWTYDAQTNSRYTGERGTVYYETRRVQVRNADGNMVTREQQVPKIRWRSVSGRVARAFDDVLVLASKSLPKK